MPVVTHAIDEYFVRLYANDLRGNLTRWAAAVIYLYSNNSTVGLANFARPATPHPTPTIPAASSTITLKRNSTSESSTSFVTKSRSSFGGNPWPTQANRMMAMPPSIQVGSRLVKRKAEQGLTASSCLDLWPVSSVTRPSTFLGYMPYLRKFRFRSRRCDLAESRT